MNEFKLISAMLLLLASPMNVLAAELNAEEQLGKLIYFDTNLSEPAGQACASCHAPTAGFADPDVELPVSEGVISGRFGGRNSPSAAYAAQIPAFLIKGKKVTGGQFWDGRAANLVEQAKGPFLNPVEMNNDSKAQVVDKIIAAAYKPLFEEVYGLRALADVDKAYHLVATAIAAYERSSELNQFTSKFDAVAAGLAEFTPLEQQGLTVYEWTGKCKVCHTIQRDKPTFTDNAYHNIGLPKNLEYPLAEAPVDYGLGAVLKDASYNGKFKTPTLRNVALTAPFMHNGVLKTLKQVVNFYNTRDVGGWDAPEVPETIDSQFMGNLRLTPQEEDALVAFLLTLTDGYQPDVK